MFQFSPFTIAIFIRRFSHSLADTWHVILFSFAFSFHLSSLPHIILELPTMPLDNIIILIHNSIQYSVTHNNTRLCHTINIAFYVNEKWQRNGHTEWRQNRNQFLSSKVFFFICYQRKFLQIPFSRCGVSFISIWKMSMTRITTAVASATNQSARNFPFAKTTTTAKTAAPNQK